MVGPPHQSTSHRILKMLVNLYEYSPHWSIFRHFWTLASWTTYVTKMKKYEFQESTLVTTFHPSDWYAVLPSCTERSWKSIAPQHSTHWKYHTSTNTPHLQEHSQLLLLPHTIRKAHWRFLRTWYTPTNPYKKAKPHEFSHIRNASSLPPCMDRSMPNSHFFLHENCI